MNVAAISLNKSQWSFKTIYNWLYAGLIDLDLFS